MSTDNKQEGVRSVGTGLLMPITDEEGRTCGLYETDNPDAFALIISRQIQPGDDVEDSEYTFVHKGLFHTAVFLTRETVDTLRDLLNFVSNLDDLPRLIAEARKAPSKESISE